MKIDIHKFTFMLLLIAFVAGCTDETRTLPKQLVNDLIGKCYTAHMAPVYKFDFVRGGVEAVYCDPSSDIKGSK